MELFGKDNIFDTPKPEELIQRIITLPPTPATLFSILSLVPARLLPWRRKWGGAGSAWKWATMPTPTARCVWTRWLRVRTPAASQKRRIGRAAAGIASMRSHLPLSTKTPLTNMSSTRTTMPICWRLPLPCTRAFIISRMENCSGNSLWATKTATYL